MPWPKLLSTVTAMRPCGAPPPSPNPVEPAPNRTVRHEAPDLLALNCPAMPGLSHMPSAHSVG
ncbi:hypothetical protein SLNWT_3017 [Streptomyces albus]|uniref:Uncharacterized protein n=1 Tax=Streptomyces albus (strain ATCC 21838 / DSM 41398 / FERM P-419 / JCM 4703 / NBRC 107858) TaxID=1081613 RepID=A0A0B5ELV5_STRA4|nr:hypothetical protein SLNWT_3017 [Streptomyces albus]AOU77703.1 hypothetical protein SLNHY_3012 [Streptomyces albus]AYN33466.1 hypothetical protein DUI70_2967 [Streptomyces albus]